MTKLEISKKKKKSEPWKTHIGHCEPDSVPIHIKAFLIILVVILLTNLFFRSYPASEIGGDSREESPRFRGQGRRLEEPHHVQGAVVVGAQEGLEELSHIEGQKQRW